VKLTVEVTSDRPVVVRDRLPVGFTVTGGDDSGEVRYDRDARRGLSDTVDTSIEVGADSETGRFSFGRTHGRPGADDTQRGYERDPGVGSYRSRSSASRAIRRARGPSESAYRRTSTSTVSGCRRE